LHHPVIQAQRESLGRRPKQHLHITRLQGKEFIKKVEDYALAALAVFLFLPASVLIALAIKLDSPGPILARQSCRGRDGRIFSLLRFRTARPVKSHAVWQESIAKRRVNRAGRLLLQTKLDMLPLFINVLRGEMSIVGPSPQILTGNECCPDAIDCPAAPHRFKPGMTGLAQVHGLTGEVRSLRLEELRQQLDLEYALTWSVWLDLKIIAKTALPVRAAETSRACRL
jgi:lipopolysaccharide/colanic/teichoic acid biosynthesis glycosyltransferase